MKYSLSPREISWALPSGFPMGSGYMSLYILPLVTIQIQYSTIQQYKYSDIWCLAPSRSLLIRSQDTLSTALYPTTLYMFYTVLYCALVHCTSLPFSKLNFTVSTVHCTVPVLDLMFSTEVCVHCTVLHLELYSVHCTLCTLNNVYTQHCVHCSVVHLDLDSRCWENITITLQSLLANPISWTYCLTSSFH